jgi:hypothetical protein
MRDRFRGGSALPTGTISTKQTWDTGTGPEQVKAESRRTNAGSIKSEAKFNNSGKKLTPATLGGTTGKDVGRSVTAAPSYPGVKGGMGPKVKVGGQYAPIQGGRTTGPDKSPSGGGKAGSSRFAGRSRAR